MNTVQVVQKFKPINPFVLHVSAGRGRNRAKRPKRFERSGAMERLDRLERGDRGVKNERR